MYFSNIPRAINLLTAQMPYATVEASPGPAVLAEVNGPMMETEPKGEEITFAELRRKIREAEVLSAATEKLLRNLRFSGRLSVVATKGCILKTVYLEVAHRPQDRRRVKDSARTRQSGIDFRFRSSVALPFIDELFGNIPMRVAPC